MAVNWGKKTRAKRVLLGGTYMNVPTSAGPMAAHVEVSLVYEVRLGTCSGDESARGEGTWEDVVGDLGPKLEELADRTVEILAQAAPKGAAAERIAQIELFEGLEHGGNA